MHRTKLPFGLHPVVKSDSKFNAQFLEVSRVAAGGKIHIDNRRYYLPQAVSAAMPMLSPMLRRRGRHDGPSRHSSTTKSLSMSTPIHLRMGLLHSAMRRQEPTVTSRASTARPPKAIDVLAGCMEQGKPYAQLSAGASNPDSG